MGLIEACAATFPDARWQRCGVHFYRNVFSKVPRSKMRDVAAMLKAVHAQENHPEMQKKDASVGEALREMKLGDAAKIVDSGIHETLSYFAFPSEHWRRIRTNNRLERLMKEIRRRTRVVGAFPDGQSAVMLVAARLRHVTGTQWTSRKYWNIDLLREMPAEQVRTA